MASERILIAEDEPAIRELAQLVLELEGYEVTIAENGWRALEHATRSRFHLLLTDYQMPDMNGFDLFRRIREQEPDLIGVAMTGYGTVEIATQAIRHGFTDFVTKPFIPDDLLIIVRRALETERLRRENARLKALIPLFELSRAVMSDPYLETLLERIIRIALAETRATRAALLLGQAGRFEVAAQTGEPYDYDAPWHALAAHVLHTARPLVIDAHDESTVPLPRFEIPKECSILAVPLFTNKVRPLGALLLGKPVEALPFVQSDADLANIIAGHAAVAIENAQLWEEREDAFQALQTLDQLKSEFVNIAAHELRTPLALVLGYAELLEEEAIGDVVKEHAHTIVRHALRLRTIVEEMTDLRYLEQERGHLRLSEVNLLSLIEERRLTVAAAYSEGAIQTHVVVEPTAAIVKGDVEKLGLVLESLLSNAYKFSPPGSTIEIRAETCEDDVIVSVCDQGPGIPAAEQSKIWTRFYQVGSSLTRSQGGMGVGLAMVKGLVELHGGRVWMESEEGVGSTFSFTIPRKVLIK